MSEAVNLTPRQAMLALSALPRLGPVTIRRLLAAFDDDPVAVLGAHRTQWQRVERIGAETAQVLEQWRQHVDPVALEARLQRSGVDFVSLADKAYPVPLRQIYDPPVGLYFKGPLRPGVKSVAIVGSRRTTLYGQSTAQMLGRELASLGFCVVSGMARGIDTAAHKGALSVGGQTVAVLGCGVDVVYPPENIDLYQQIAQKGALISELPPGARASKTTFPMRNRLISGLSAAVIVVETDRAGGSMITARFAAEHNRPLFAVPGRIDQSTSQGCHQLIRDGAILLTSVDDLIEELAYGGRVPGQSSLDFSESESGAADDAAKEGTQSVSLYGGAAILEDGSNGNSGDNGDSGNSDGSGGGISRADSIGGDNEGAFDRAAVASGNAGAALPEGGSIASAKNVVASAEGGARSAADAALTPDARALLGALQGGERLGRDQLARATGLPVAAVASTLLLLELRRRIVRRADGTFEAR